MSQRPSNADPSIEGQLVAYLDGELDAEASRRVEEMLSGDPKVRQTLQGLDRTWELLDELEQPQVAARFTQSTLEMVTVAAAEDTERNRAKATRRRRWRWVTLGGSLLAAGCVGFIAMGLRPDPNRELIEDLPVLENLDEYRQIDDVEFLRALHEHGVFAEEGEPADLVVTNVFRTEDWAAARRRIENMKPAEKKQLLRQQDRFAALGQAEQQRLHRLHEQLSDAPKLRRVMHAYCEWFKSLPAYVRAELLDLKPEERIVRIQELRAEEAKRPKLKDMDGLFRWIKQYVADPDHQAEILKENPEGGGQHFPQLTGPDDRTWVAARILWEHLRPRRPAWHGWPDWSDRPRWLTAEVLADLRQYLSSATRKRLEQMSPDQQWEAISGWVEYSRVSGSSNLGFRGGPPPQELVEQLDKYFAELSPEERYELLNLPPDQMLRELQTRYFRSLGLTPGPSAWRGGGMFGDRGGRDEPRPGKAPQPPPRPD